MNTTSPDTMLDEAWVLSPAVALRPEPFGAMAYHFDNRRLTFLKRPEIVRLVESLAGCATVREAMVVARLPEHQWPAYITALRSLAETDMIRARAREGKEQ
ncbi:mycofactocin biosynthesis chaperone MftB [Paenarthrobacter aromaticivorans]|jgi:putative mycofactocin binding protein MftB|uniref:Mycofactocin biosynthesis chaperone MftB n=1 Tax=Paenarthrobacter aromaticivorans TaxID=2849150 RepID=A0ABS6IA93_9MICC|nr:mycofactocin biosynthesis chaperone MftB [Paenarthrobacter sp. MMS21-TAE1-1]MBU8868514.1 mycofactocin biosynthesis chaperone MftB [Paenarthrobacter sp. MMS21-TAE1-1]